VRCEIVWLARCEGGGKRTEVRSGRPVCFCFELVGNPLRGKRLSNDYAIVDH